MKWLDEMPLGVALGIVSVCAFALAGILEFLKLYFL